MRKNTEPVDIFYLAKGIFDSLDKLGETQNLGNFCDTIYPMYGGFDGFTRDIILPLAESYNLWAETHIDWEEWDDAWSCRLNDTLAPHFANFLANNFAPIPEMTPAHFTSFSNLAKFPLKQP